MMRRQLAAVLLAATISVPLAAQAQAQAQCEVRPPHPREFRQSSLVLTGQVSAVEKHPESGFIDYTVTVARRLKGKAPAALVIRSEIGPKGFQMNGQRSYLLFVSQRPDKTWFVNNCGNSAPMPRKENIVKREPIPARRLR